MGSDPTSSDPTSSDPLDRTALAQARMLLDARRPDQALERIGPVLGRHPDDPEPLLLTARALLDRDAAGDAAEARRIADRLLRAAPDDAQTWWVVAQTRRRTADALEAGRRMVRLAPGEAWALQYLIDLAVRAGATAEAERAVLEALRLAPDDPFSHSRLGDVRLQQHRDDEAVAAYGAALALDPHDPDALRGMAAVGTRGDDAGAAAAAAGLARLQGADPGDDTTDAYLEAATARLIVRLALIAAATCAALILLAPLAGGLFGLAAPVPLRPLPGLALQQLVTAAGVATGVLAYRRLQGRLGDLLPRLLRARFGDGPYVTIALGFLGAAALLAVAGVVAGGIAGGLAGGVLLVMAADCALTALIFAAFLGTVLGGSVAGGYAKAVVALVLVAPGALLAAAFAVAAFVPFSIGFIVWNMRRLERERATAEQTATVPGGAS